MKLRSKEKRTSSSDSEKVNKIRKGNPDLMYNNELNKLKEQNRCLTEELNNLKSVTSYSSKLEKPKQITNRDWSFIDVNNKWLSDEILQSYFETMTDEISKVRKDILLIGPALTQVLKEGSLYDVTATLTSLDFYNKNVVCLCLNNCAESKTSKNQIHDLQNRGSHWSLVVYSRLDCTVYHFDSIKGYNYKSARCLVDNIGWTKENFEEVSVSQQTNNFECGLHVLVNCRLLLSHLNSNVETQFKIYQIMSNLNMKNKEFLKQTKVGTGESRNKLTTADKESDSTFSRSKQSFLKSRLINPELATQKKLTSYMTEQKMASTQTLNSDYSWKTIKQKSIKGVFKPFSINCCNSFLPLSNDSVTCESEDQEIDGKEKSKLKFDMTKNGRTSNKYTKSLRGYLECKNKDIRTNNKFVKTRKFLNDSPFVNDSPRKIGLANSIESNTLLLGNNIARMPYETSFEEMKSSNTKSDIVKSTSSAHQIKILADSHGREVRKILLENLSKPFQIYSEIKPNGKMVHVLNRIKAEADSLTKNDFILVIGGTNDIERNFAPQNFVNDIEDKLKLLSHTNVILSNIPFRYDKPWLNQTIRDTNRKMKILTEKYSFLNLVSLNCLTKVNYTKRGLHLNHIGKSKISKVITNLIEEPKQFNIPVRITKRKPFLDYAVSCPFKT